jgi:hypothetical protein
MNRTIKDQPPPFIRSGAIKAIAMSINRKLNNPNWREKRYLEWGNEPEWLIRQRLRSDRMALLATIVGALAITLLIYFT